MQRCKKVFERSSLFVEPEAAGSASSPLGEKLTLRIDAQEYSRGCTARVSSYLQSLNGSINLLQPRFPKPGWRNWQTQRTQNPPGFGPWGFDSPSRHQPNVLSFPGIQEAVNTPSSASFSHLLDSKHPSYRQKHHNYTKQKP